MKARTIEIMYERPLEKNNNNNHNQTDKQYLYCSAFFCVYNIIRHCFLFISNIVFKFHYALYGTLRLKIVRTKIGILSDLDEIGRILS